ncbi:MAG: hypothetical protein ACX93O_06310 [Flagellimonas sp.]
MKDYYTLKRWEWAILIILLVLSIFAPLFFTQLFSGVSFMNTGQIGDTIGGTTAPFINLIAAFLVYKSFTAQIRANLDQRESHRLEMESIREQQGIDTIIHLFSSIESFVMDRPDAYNNLLTICKDFNKRFSNVDSNYLLNDQGVLPDYQEFLDKTYHKLRTIKTHLVQIENLVDYINSHQSKYPNIAFGQLYRTKVRSLLLRLRYLQFSNTPNSFMETENKLIGQPHMEYQACISLVNTLLLKLMDDGSNNPRHYQ